MDMIARGRKEGRMVCIEIKGESRWRKWLGKDDCIH